MPLNVPPGFPYPRRQRLRRLRDPPVEQHAIAAYDNALREELIQLEAQRVRLSATNIELQNANDDLKKAKDYLLKENRNLQRRANGMEQSIVALKRDQDKTKEALADYDKQVEGLRKELQKMREGWSTVKRVVQSQPCD
jgi:chromosome segregation ATPase